VAINGTVGNDNLFGTGGNDLFRLHQGGDDSAFGDDGNDRFRIDAAFTAADSINGGDDRDTLMLKGDYSSGVVFGAATLTRVEVLRLSGNFTYDLTTHDATVAAGEMITVKAAKLGAGQHLVFDGSAETDGKFAIHASAGDDTLTGGAKLDRFFLGKGGTDTAYGGDGDDRFYLGDTFTASDSINGGTGFDAVVLDGLAVGDDLNFSATTMTGIDRVVLETGFIYSLSIHDANIAAGELLYVVGLNAGNGFTGFRFDASAETDGVVQIVGSSQSDQLYGGAQNDVFDLTYGGGNDEVDGNGGDDFIYMGSTLGGLDQVDGGAGHDRVYLNGNYAGLVLTAANVVNAEILILGGGNDYGITTDDGNVAAGERLEVDASTLDTSDELSFLGGAETDGAFDIIAGGGEANIIGGAQNDTFTLSNVSGLKEITVDGRAGADTFFFGANFSFTNHGLDGGTGTDTLALDGDYAATVLSAIAPHGVNNIENLSLVVGHDYTIDVISDITGGTSLTVDASTLIAGDVLDIDFTAATSSLYQVLGGAGDDTFRMGALRASEMLTGAAGFDTVTMTDMVESGSDTLTFSATTLVGIDRLVAAADVTFDIATNDGTVAGGATLEVDMSALATSGLGWNGLAESDGHFDVTGGGAGGFISGGALSDTITMSAHTQEYYVNGGGGADNITCNTGGDRFVVSVVAESASTTHDVIAGFNANEDRFDTATTVTVVNSVSGGVNTADFDDDMGDVINDAIFNQCAVVVTVTGGDLIGHVFLVVDGDHNGTYDGGLDYVFDITGFTGTLDASDFI
jgi:hypothetical protein